MAAHPALHAIDPGMPAKDQLRATMEAKVRGTVERIVAAPEVQRAQNEKRDVRLVGALDELATGNVRWLRGKRRA